MHEANLSVQYRSLYARLSNKFDVQVSLWCNHRWDLLYLDGNNLGDAINVLEDEIGIYDTVTDDTEALVFTSTCLRDHGEDFIEADLERYDCRTIPPLTYDGGTISLRILAADFEQLSNLFDVLVSRFNVSVDSKRELDSVGYEILLPRSTEGNLTDRQRSALMNAYKEGYYEIPRRTRTVDLAETLDIDRRTFEYHLRRAEAKIVEYFLQHQ